MQRGNGRGNSAAASDLPQAAQGLIPLAQQLAAQNHVLYKMQLTSSDTSGSGGGGGYGNGNSGGDQNAPNQSSGDNRGGSTGWASYGAALDAISAGVAAPGDGATPAGAQAVILLASDGSLGVPSADDLASCAAIKSRGIVIAVFYAPASSAAGRNGQQGRSDQSNRDGNGNAQGNASYGQDGVAAGLQACASLQQGGAQTGGAALFLQQGGDQSTQEALAALFAMAAANAHLVH